MSRLNKGRIYVLYNPGTTEDCYKVLFTKHITRIINFYNKCYPEDFEVKYISNEISNYKNMLKKIRNKLREYHIKSDFFKCNLNIIIDCIKEFSSSQPI